MCVRRQTLDLERRNFLVAFGLFLVLTRTQRRLTLSAPPPHPLPLLFLITCRHSRPRPPHYFPQVLCGPPQLTPSPHSWNGHSICLGIKVRCWLERRFGLVPQADLDGTASVVWTTSAFLFQEIESKKSSEVQTILFQKVCPPVWDLGKAFQFCFAFFAAVHLLFPPLKLFTVPIISLDMSFFIYIYLLYCCFILWPSFKSWTGNMVPDRPEHISASLQRHFSTSESWTMILQLTVIIELINNNEK